MKKLFTSAGLVALSASSLQAAYTPNLTAMQTSKPWSVSAGLRGFYDDNYTTSVDSARRGSIGYEFNPSASLNLPLDQTFIGLSYDYSLRFYEDRRNHKYDQTHKFDFRLDHAFTERYKLNILDSFVIAQEPEVLSPGGAVATPLRTAGDNVRNHGSIDFIAQVTEPLGFEFGYANTFYDYRQDGADILAGDSASRSGLLDRLEHLISLSLRWQLREDTAGLLGYKFGVVDFTSDEDIGIDGATGTLLSAEDRNSKSHTLFVGADHRFNSQLNASIRLGGQYTDFDEHDNNPISPYLDASITYQYNRASHVQAGVSHSRIRTDVATIESTDDITVDQEVTALYVSLTHRITPRLTGNLLVQGQRGVLEGGTADSDVEYFLLTGLSVAYQINPFLSAEAGYNFDRFDADIENRSYSRNRVYVGIRGTY